MCFFIATFGHIYSNSNIILIDERGNKYRKSTKNGR